MKHFIFPMLIIATVLISSCKDKEDCNKCACEYQASGVDSLAMARIPNVFTPNDDGVNDVLHVYGIGIDSFYLEIKDGGYVVFQTNDLNMGWDGTVNGTISVTCHPYYYVADVFFDTGYHQHIEGSVLLFRNDGTFCPDEFQDCRFGNQYDGQEFNTSLSSGEGNC